MNNNSRSKPSSLVVVLANVWASGLVAVWSAGLRSGWHAGCWVVGPTPRSTLLSEGPIASRTAAQLLRLSIVVEGIVHVVPRALERDTRVQECQEAAGEDDHNALQDHEQSLVLSEELSGKTTRELDASVHTSDEDHEGGEDETNEEELEEAGLGEREVSRVPGLLVTPHAECEPTSGNGEQDNGEDLEPQTRQHDVLSGTQEGRLLGGRRDTPPDSLQKQTDEVAGAEDNGVCARPKPREVGAVDYNNP